MMQDFVHLRMHSEYSFRDSTIRIDPIVHKATAAGMKALALTDLAVMFGHIFFYKACLKQGVKPILGVDVWVSNPNSPTAPNRLLLLCKNKVGYHSLCEFLTKAWLENQIEGKGVIDLQWLNKKNCSGLIALSGFNEGSVGKALLNDKARSAQDEAKKLAALFEDRFYLELQRIGRNGEDSLIEKTVELAKKLDLPLVATHPIQFQEAEDHTDHDIRCCIVQGVTLNRLREEKPFTPAQYFKTKEEMIELFKDIPSAIENSVEIAKRCNLSLNLGHPELPKFETPDGTSLDEYMAQLAREGLEKRLKISYPDKKKRDAARPPYDERLEREIGVIQKMGFSGYFLIVQDFIRWAKTHECPVGPGRGSGAGSLVAYSLGITNLDPLEYGLLFERFLNPERISMPDFDVDFCQDNRDRVIEYVKERYGADAVSQIATFGTMGARGVLKDVGRILDFGYSQTDALAKYVPLGPAQTSLIETINKEPEFRRIIRNSPDLKPLISTSIKLEGLCRNIGIHAGGVLIAPSKLTDFCPLYSADMKPENVVSMYDKNEVEEAGLVKFDFLGLTTLTIIARTLDYIKRNTGEDIDIEQISTTDKKVFDKIFKPADTKMIFQFESAGMRNLMIRSVPNKLSDLIALNALYRPGPMKLAGDFIDYRKGVKKPEYADERLKPFLKETSGIMIYQEQVMQVAQTIAGYSLGSADILRRAMGKKHADEMEAQLKPFIEGAKKNGVKEEVAMDIFSKMAQFAQYGFNKSHAAAYSYVAYQTAWLKCYYPAEFIASNLSEVLTEPEKIYSDIADAIEHKIKVLPIDINHSDYFFTSPDSKTIRFGMGAIKGMGRSAAEEISAERAKNGPFKDMYDLATRVGTKFISRKILEILALAGAFDSIDKNRRKLFTNANQVYTAALAKEQAGDQMGLFGEDIYDPTETMVECIPWDKNKTAEREKSVLGFYFSVSPLDAVRSEIEKRFRRRTVSAINCRGERKLQFGAFGVVTDVIVRSFAADRDNPDVEGMGNSHFCVLNIDDGFTRIQMRVASSLYEKARSSIKLNEVYFVEGFVGKPENNENLSWLINNFASLSEIRASRGAKLRMQLSDKIDLGEFKDILKEMHSNMEKANCQIELTERRGDAGIKIPLPMKYGIVLSTENLTKLANDGRFSDVAVCYD